MPNDITLFYKPPGPDVAENLRPRQRMLESLPRWQWLQLMLTVITGVAYEGQVLPRRSPWYHLSRAVLVFVLGIGLALYGCLNLSLATILLIPLGWFLVTAAARNLQVTILHAASHKNFSGIGWIDAVVGRSIATVLLLPSFPGYRTSHLEDHHGSGLATARDGTVKDLTVVAGLAPGMPSGTLRSVLIRALFSPRVHARMFFKGRLYSQLCAGDAMTKIAAGTYLIGLGYAIAWVGMLPIAISLLLPLTVFYQQAQLLRLCVEHRWARSGAPRTRETITAMTVPVFLGEAPPKQGGILAWGRWWLRMVGHALVRIVILPGDSGPGHDLHHDDVRADWANHIAARQAINTTRRQKGLPLRGGVWGYLNALHLCFESYSTGSISER